MADVMAVDLDCCPGGCGRPIAWVGQCCERCWARVPLIVRLCIMPPHYTPTDEATALTVLYGWFASEKGTVR